MQNHLAATWVVITCAATSVFADDATFELKGRSLGQSPDVACQGAAVTERSETLSAAGMRDIQFPAAICDVYIESVATVSVPEYARLLFWRGQLTRVVIRFGTVDLEPHAAIRSALVDAYGKPTVRRTKPFRTDTWKKGLEQLELWQTDRFPSDVELFLTHIDRWREYEQASTRVDAMIEKLLKDIRQRDLKN